MAALPPLAMSQAKDDLVKHLNMEQETYTMMAKETDNVYKWLTSDKRHLKSNCKRKPPYDWSDIVEKSKDEAMRRIAQSSNPQTSYYWKLATPNEDDCPNWIARWFLYHKFRYRDGRNRNAAKGEDGKHTHSNSSKHSHYKRAGGSEESNGYYYNQDSYYADSMNADSEPAQGYAYPGTGSSSTINEYIANGYAQPSQTYQYHPSAQTYKEEDQGYEQEGRKGYWDPARDE